MNPPVRRIQWLRHEAKRFKTTPEAIWARYLRGGYPKIKLKRKNARVVFVLNSGLKPEPKPHKIPSLHRCDCGRVAYKKDSAGHTWVCRRCHRIEHRYWQQYNRDKARSLLQKQSGLSEYRVVGMKGYKP